MTLEYWDASDPETTWFQSFTLRIENKCKGKAIVMGAPPGIMTTYAGATLELTGMFTGTTVSGSTTIASDCPIQAVFEVELPSGIKVTNTDAEFRKVVSLAKGPVMSGSTSEMTFKPSTADYGQGAHDAYVELTIIVRYVIVDESDSKTFKLKV